MLQLLWNQLCLLTVSVRVYLHHLVFRTGFCKLKHIPLGICDTANAANPMELWDALKCFTAEHKKLLDNRRQSHPSQATQCSSLRNSKKGHVSWCKMRLFAEKLPSQIHRMLQPSKQRTPYPTGHVNWDNSSPFWTGDCRKCCITWAFVEQHNLRNIFEEVHDDSWIK